MPGTRRVSIGGVPAQADGWAVVVVDVLRATTVLCTAAWLGRPCLVAATVEEARALRERTPEALLAGEQGGVVPDGFDLGNSPADVARRTDRERPIVLVTSSGTPMLRAAERAAAVVFAASLRNITGQVQFLIDSDLDVAVVPTGSGGLPREEDDLCAAYLAAALLDEGFAADSRSLEHVSRWARRPVSVCAEGASAAFLRRAGHVEDLEFVLSHVDDLAAAFPMTGSRIDCVPVP